MQSMAGIVKKDVSTTQTKSSTIFKKKISFKDESQAQTLQTDDAIFTTNQVITLDPLSGTKSMINGSKYQQYAFQHENSCLLDESYVQRAMRIPNPDGTKAHLQAELNHHVQNDPVINYFDEMQENQIVDGSFYKIVDKDSIEIIDGRIDRYPCLKLRKIIMKYRVYAQRFAAFLIKTPAFETISIIVIVANSLFLAMEDPTSDVTPAYMILSDYIFQTLYSIEMVFKICGKGFIWNKGAYLRDAWNILDFVIVVSGFAAYIQSGKGANLQALRSFRVLRPLRTISTIQGLRVIVSALMSSLPLLRDSMLVILFFFIIMAIAGVQLFSGELKMKCIQIETGIYHPLDSSCGGARSCPIGYYCGKTNDNPNFGTTNFDNFMYALLAIFQIVTLEGWYSTMVLLEQSVGTYVIAYFVIVVLVGAYFLLKLMLAVIKSKFTEEHKIRTKQRTNKKKNIVKIIESEESDDMLQGELDQSQQEKEGIEDYAKKQAQIINQIRVNTLLKRVDMTLKQKEEQALYLQEKEKQSTIQNQELSNRSPLNKLLQMGQINKNKNGQLNQQKVNDMYSTNRVFDYQASSSQMTMDDFKADTNMDSHKEILLIEQERRNSNPIASSMVTHPVKNRQSATNKNKIIWNLTRRSVADETIKEAAEESNEQSYLEDQLPNQQINNNRMAITSQGPRQSYVQYNNNNGWTETEAQQQYQSPTTVKNRFQVRTGSINPQKTVDYFDINRVSTAAPNQQRSQQMYFSPQPRQKGQKEVQQTYADEAGKESQFEADQDLADIDNDEDDDQNIDYEGAIENYNDIDDLYDNDSFERDFYDKTYQITKSHNANNNIDGATISHNQLLKKLTRSDVSSIDQLIDCKQTENDLQQSPAKIDKIDYNDIQRLKRLQTQIFAHKGYVSDQDQAIQVRVNSSFRQKAQGLLTQIVTKKKKIGKSGAKGIQLTKKLEVIKRVDLSPKVIKRNLSQSLPQMNKSVLDGVNQLWLKSDKNKTIAPKQQSILMNKLERMTVAAITKRVKEIQIVNEMKQHIMREFEMKRRRNKYFAKSIRNIGLSKKQLKQEKTTALEQSRKIQLKGGFIEAAPDSPKYNKRTLRRTGSLQANANFWTTRTTQRTNQNFESQGQLLDEVIETKKQPQIALITKNKVQPFTSQVTSKGKDIHTPQGDTTKGGVNNEDINDSDIDIDQVLQHYKKKIIMKRRRFKFTSQDDVLELRDDEDQDNKENEGQEKEDEKNKKDGDKDVEKSVVIFKGYQKKIMYYQRVNFEELLQQDAIESDDNQDTVLERLEYNYDAPHRSNIYVTGTLSIAVNVPENLKKINSNNIQNVMAQSQNTSINMGASAFNMAALTVGAPGSNQLSRMLSSNMNMRAEISISQSSMNKSSYIEGGSKQASNNPIQSQRSNVRRQTVVGGGAGASQFAFANKGRQQSINNRIVKQNTRQMSVIYGRMSQSQMYGITSGFLGQSKISMLNTKKVEMYTDKQILRKLNDEIMRSKVLAGYDVKKLPKSIHRAQDLILSANNDDFLSNPTQSKEQQNKLPIKVKVKKDNEDDSDASEEEEFLENDMFLDRCEDPNQEVLKAKQDSEIKVKDRIEWSGQDIMMRMDPYIVRKAIDSFNETRVWPYDLHGIVKYYRVKLRNFINTTFYDNFLILCVVTNTVVLTMDYYGIDTATTNTLNAFNTVFTYVFTVEMGLKIIAIGLKKYLTDKMNYLDSIVVILSLVEVAISSGKGALGALKAVRIFRIFRVLRVARLLRSIKSMMDIINVLQRSMNSFIYLTMLLFLFVFIYALLGMQIYGGQFNFPEGIPRINYDSFINSFIASFAVLTVDSWNRMMILALRSDSNFLISALYYISWLFIGNYMLFNLFLSIVLDSFTEVDAEAHETREEKLQKFNQQQDNLIKYGGEDLIVSMKEPEQNAFDLIDNNKGGKSSMGKSGNRPKAGKGKKKKKRANADTFLLDESIEIDMEMLAQKRLDESNKVTMLFEGNDCEISVYIFDKVQLLTSLYYIDSIQKNRLRVLLYKVVQHKIFEWIIMFLILASSIKLVFDTYIINLTDSDPKVFVSNQINYFFTVAFCLESLFKTIAYGFIFDKGSYLRDTWSQLDFFIVFTSMIDVCLTNVQIPFIKVLRLLRILRPLRFLSSSSSLKTVVIAISQSLGGIFNVAIVISMILLMFSIMGVNLFGGKFQYCSIDRYLNISRESCFHAGGSWTTYDINFDTFPHAMISFFILATKEGWIDIMFQAIDADTQGMGPVLNSSSLAAYFIILYVFLSSFLFMNLFIGIIYMNFEAAQREEKESTYLSNSEIKWIDMLKMVVSTKPDVMRTPNNKVSKWIYKKTKSETKFDFAIMVFIVLNMLSMAVTYETQTRSFENTLRSFNYIFTAIFICEATLKIIAQGWSYFQQGWNQFDFFVVCASILDIVINMLGDQLAFLKAAPQIVRVLRVLRVSRLFRLLNKYKGLQALIQTITFALPSLLNILMLLMLAFFIFAILGVFLFNQITRGQIIDDYTNFANFSSALVTLFRMSTGEQWYLIMFDCMNTSPNCIKGVTCGASYAPAYFIAFQMVCTYIVLNLFILVILQQFQLYYLGDDNILAKFREDLQQFKLSWAKYSKEFHGIKIRSVDLTSFFKNLQGNLGMNKEKEQNILRHIVKFGLESDEEGFIYFNELLFKAMKRVYGEERTKNKLLIQAELQALEKLQQIKAKLTKISRHDAKIKAVTVNPFLTIMYKRLSFKAWIARYKQNKGKRQDEQEFQLDRFSSDDEVDENGVITHRTGKEDSFEYVTEEDVSVHSEEEEEEDDDEDDSSYDSDDLNPPQINDGVSSVVGGIGGTNSINVPGMSSERDGLSNFSIKLKKTMKAVYDDAIDDKIVRL